MRIGRFGELVIMPRPKKEKIKTVVKSESAAMTPCDSTASTVISVKMSNLATMIADLQAEWNKFKEHQLSKQISGTVAPTTTTIKPTKTYPGQPKPPKTPLQLFLGRKLKDKGDVSEEVKKKYRAKYSELSDEKQCKWISKAIEDHERYLRECHEFTKRYPDFVPTNKPNITIKERILHDRIMKGRPVPPPRSAYILFCKDIIGSKEHEDDMPDDPRDKMRYYSGQWSSLKPDDHQSQEERLNQAIEDYIEQMTEYLENQPEEERLRIAKEEPKTLPEHYRRLLARRYKKADTPSVNGKQ